MPTVTANGIELFYERWGTGPRLLFFNGSGSSIATSELLIKLFTNDFEVLVHDQRGLGQQRDSARSRTRWPTTRPTPPRSSTTSVGTRARSSGVSFGGMVAQEFAVTGPERVERLALLCTSPGGAGGASYPLHELASLPEAERARVGTQLLDTRFTPEWLDGTPGDRGLADMMAARRGGEKTAEQLRGEAEQTRGAQPSRRERSPGRGDVPDVRRVRSLRRHRAAARTARRSRARFPSAELRVYEGGHAFFAQDRAALPDVLAFLAARDAQRRERRRARRRRPVRPSPRTRRFPARAARGRRRRRAPIATYANAPPTEIRFTPTLASSATVGAFGQGEHVHREIDRRHDPPDVVEVGEARREQHVGAGLLVRLQPRDRVGEVGVARGCGSRRAR